MCCHIKRRIIMKTSLLVVSAFLQCALFGAAAETRELAASVSEWKRREIEPFTERSRDSFYTCCACVPSFEAMVIRILWQKKEYEKALRFISCADLTRFNPHDIVNLLDIDFMQLGSLFKGLEKIDTDNTWNEWRSRKLILLLGILKKQGFSVAQCPRAQHNLGDFCSQLDCMPMIGRSSSIIIKILFDMGYPLNTGVGLHSQTLPMVA